MLVIFVSKDKQLVDGVSQAISGICEANNISKTITTKTITAESGDVVKWLISLDNAPEGSSRVRVAIADIIIGHVRSFYAQQPGG